MKRYTLRAVSEPGGPYSIFVTFSDEYIRSLLPNPILISIPFKESLAGTIEVLAGLLEDFQEWMVKEGRLPISQSSDIGFQAKYVFEKKQDAALFKLFFDGDPS